MKFLAKIVHMKRLRPKLKMLVLVYVEGGVLIRIKEIRAL